MTSHLSAEASEAAATWQPSSEDLRPKADHVTNDEILMVYGLLVSNMDNHSTTQTCFFYMSYQGC